jgi:hypothetical protein
MIMRTHTKAERDCMNKADLKRNVRPVRDWSRRCLLSLALAMSAHGAAQAVSVSYAAVDLPDVAGQDVWRLDYTVSGSFTLFDAINLLFDPNRFAQLQLTPPAVGSGLDALLTAPNASLGTEGQLLLTALQTQPDSFTAQLSVQFVNLGTASPGSQPYEVLDGDFNIQARGNTVPLTTLVPEPGDLTLLLAGLCTLGAAAAWQRRRLTPDLQNQSAA